MLFGILLQLTDHYNMLPLYRTPYSDDRSTLNSVDNSHNGTNDVLLCHI